MHDPVPTASDFSAAQPSELELLRAENAARRKALAKRGTAADRFAAIMWDYFIDGASIDGFDLQVALEKSGLARGRPCTAEEAVAADREEGDELTFLTDEGKATVARGKTFPDA